MLDRPPPELEEMQLRSPRTFVLILIYFCGAPLPITGQAAAPDHVVPRCEVREFARQELRIEGGKALYVDPATLEASDAGDVFIAGQYNHLYASLSDGTWAREPRDSIFGVIVPVTGEPRIVRSPFPSLRVLGARILARADGRWDVVFGETAPWTFDEPTPTSALRLWHGIHDGYEWTSFGEIPVPPEVSEFRTHASSALLRRPSGWSWAVPVQTSGLWEHVLVIEHLDGEWSSEIAPVEAAAYVDMAHDDTLGYVLAVVGPRPVPGGRDGNSLYLYGQLPRWRLLHRLADAAETQTYEPVFAVRDGRLLLSWVSEPVGRHVSRAVLDPNPLASTRSSPILLDPTLPFGARPRFLAGRNEATLWLTPSQDETGAAFRVTVAGDDDVHRGAVIGNPFTGGAGVGFLRSSRELLLVGLKYTETAPVPVEVADLGEGWGVTLLVSFELTC